MQMDPSSSPATADSPGDLAPYTAPKKGIKFDLIINDLLKITVLSFALVVCLVTLISVLLTILLRCFI